MTKPEQPFDPRPPVCVVSPHLDDAALSCASFIHGHPGTTIVTVCAGVPAGPASEWDRATTGESVAEAAVGMRRAEDALAMADLGASPVWLDLVDSQYGEGHVDGNAIVDALRGAVARLRPNSIVGPLGVHHPDHVAVSDACLDLAADAELDLYLYLEMPYARTFPEEVDSRLQDLVTNTHELTELRPIAGPDTGRKRRVAAHYASQLPHLAAAHLDFDLSLSDPERYWRVIPHRRPRRRRR